LYGSTARGENAEESDVDLLVVGKRDAELERKIVSNLKKAKIVFLTPMEYARLPRDDKAFYESVERDKIKLV
jgi:predicted nucleotidyltransferase